MLSIMETKVDGWSPTSAIFSSKKGVATSAFLIVGESEILLNRREIEVLADSLKKWLEQEEV